MCSLAAGDLVGLHRLRPRAGSGSGRRTDPAEDPVRILEGPEYSGIARSRGSTRSGRLRHPVGPQQSNYLWDLEDVPDAQPLASAVPGQQPPARRPVRSGRPLAGHGERAAETTIEFWPVSGPRRRVLRAPRHGIAGLHAGRPMAGHVPRTTSPSRLWPSRQRTGAPGISCRRTLPPSRSHPAGDHVLVGSTDAGSSSLPSRADPPRLLAESRWERSTSSPPLSTYRVAGVAVPVGFRRASGTRRFSASARVGPAVVAGADLLRRPSDRGPGWWGTGRWLSRRTGACMSEGRAASAASLSPPRPAGPSRARRLRLRHRRGAVRPEPRRNAASRRGEAEDRPVRFGPMRGAAALRSRGDTPPAGSRRTAPGLNAGRLSPSGRVIVTGDVDGVVRVGPVTGEEPHLLLGHKGAGDRRSPSRPTSAGSPRRATTPLDLADARPDEAAAPHAAARGADGEARRRSPTCASSATRRRRPAGSSTSALSPAGRTCRHGDVSTPSEVARDPRRARSARQAGSRRPRGRHPPVVGPGAPTAQRITSELSGTVADAAAASSRGRRDPRPTRPRSAHPPDGDERVRLLRVRRRSLRQRTR